MDPTNDQFLAFCDDPALVSHACLARGGSLLSGVATSRASIQLGSAIISFEPSPSPSPHLLRVALTKGIDESQEATKALNACGIDDAEMIWLPRAQFDAMRQQAAEWRSHLQATEACGTLFLIDGPSGSGKTTISDALRSDPALKLSFVRRHCTRHPRSEYEAEYVFVSHQSFDDHSKRGDFIEYKDFKFGMSYGLAWELAFSPLLAGTNALGLMNWGNARLVKHLLPEAQIILITASTETLRARLLARGVHDEAQLDERLGNATRLGSGLLPHDLIVSNEDGTLVESLATIRHFINSKCRNFRRPLTTA